MTDFFTQARTFYANLHPARQTQLWLAVVGVVIAVIGIWTYMTIEPYAEVYSGSTSQMAKAASLLREEGIPASTDGVSISVPASKRAEAMGVIQPMFADPGMTDVNGIAAGIPPRAFDYGVLRQQEGDLGRTIAAIPGINSASVKIVPGVRSLFADEPDVPARASVFLNVSPSMPPRAETIRSIAHLVGNTRNDLDPSYVAITDSLGMTHQDGQGSGSGDGAIGRDLMALQTQYEQEAQAKVSRHLRSLVGMNGAFMVAATAEVEHESRVVRKTDYDTEKILAVEKSLNEESRERTEPAAQGGAPGVDAALPERAAAVNAPGNGNSNEERSRSQEKNIAPETNEQVVIPAGALKRMSVTVSIDQAALATVWGIQPDDPKWSDEVADLKNLLQTAAGIQTDRSDSFEMVTKPFAEIPVEVAPTVTVDGVVTYTSPFVPYAIAATALLLAFMFVVRPLMAQVSKAPLPAAGVIGADGQYYETDASGRALPGAQAGNDLARRMHRMVENFQPVDSDDLNRLVEQQSDASAKVVRDWMRQEA